MQEIKKAHRSLVMQYHPDRNPDLGHTSARFIEIQEAYQVLSDAKRRAKYDDDRWLNGMGRKTSQPQTITPDWLLDVSKKLNKSLAEMDTHRISHGALAEYILLILADAHIEVLQQYNAPLKTEAIATQLIQASRWLEPQYLPPIIGKLQLLAGDDGLKNMVADYYTARQRDATRDRLFPYIILLITLVLCVVMYFYGSK